MLIVANWKAYVDDPARATKLFALSKRLASVVRATIVLAPPAPILGMLALRNKSRVSFAAQNISLATGGAHTGEVTAQAYAGAGATYAIVGHSERRLPAQAGARGESDADVALKLSHALAHGLTPILCIGEKERDGEGRYLNFVREQLTAAVRPVEPKNRAKIIYAYEPLWAIGRSAEHAIGASDLAEMVLYIRKVTAELLPGKSVRRVTVLYGGAVEVSNIRALAGGSGVDGFLVGHASVDPQTFPALVKQLAQHQIRFGAGRA